MATLPSDDYRTIKEGRLEDFATVHPAISSVSELFECLQSPPFNDAKWAFRGQSTDRLLTASIERIAIRPGVAEDYVEREFRRRAHQYVPDVPGALDDLEWLALMQHHGAPTRLLDWSRSSQVAAFFAAQSAKSSEPFVIWAVDRESVNAEAAEMLSLSGPDNDLSSRENFRKMYRDQQPDELFLIAAVQPYRMNERLTIQQGLFLCANRPLFLFRRCFIGLLLHASKSHKPSAQWLHKLVIAPETRLEVLTALQKINISAATLFPGLDGFSRSLHTGTEIQELENWPGVPLLTDRERWVRGD
jgi:hypothetical protein